ncbi:MAG: hypothetical protein ACKVHX_06885 [Alphaproteobacteria bacterium]|jgi:hypothetical protein
MMPVLIKNRCSDAVVSTFGDMRRERMAGVRLFRADIAFDFFFQRCNKDPDGWVSVLGEVA